MFADLLSTVTAFIAQHPHAAYAVVFLFAMSESLPGIGVVVPGTAIILGVSALVPSGVVKLWPMLGATISGAIVGDGLSFWLGHRYQRRLLAIWPMSRYPDIAEKGEAFFRRHGDKSVFLARFIPGVRAVVPLFAGIVGMPVWRFYLANTLSALAWAVSHVLPAVFVGAAIAQLGEAAKPLAVLVALVILLVWLSWKLVRLALGYGVPRLVRLLAQTRGWARRGEGAIARTVSGLLGQTPSDAIVLLTAGGLVVGAAWMFLGILEDVVNGDPLVRADSSVFQGLKALRTETGDVVMVTLTELGDTAVVTAVTAAALVLLVLWRAWRSATFLLIAVAGGALVNTVIKGTLHRVRPGDMEYRGWSAFSFPSGHSTSNAILYGFLAVIIARQVHPAFRLPIAFAATLLALSIAISRVYLGAHWFSDVAAGLSFGMLWLTAVSFVYLRGGNEAVPPRLLASVVGLALVAAGAVNIDRSHTADMRRYAVHSTSIVTSEKAWLDGGWKQLPDRRVDLTGEIEEPFTLQIAGSLPEIENALVASGWKRPPPWFASITAWLSPNPGPDHLPVFPLLASGRVPDLVMIRSDPSAARSRLVLRLWQSELSVSDGETRPLWLASVLNERLSTIAWLATRTKSEEDYSIPRNTVSASFKAVTPVARSQSTASWDGKVDLVVASYGMPISPGSSDENSEGR
ncbi:bifunctional DedA family/phosphatase PAP2 family protein [Rhizobium phaseoli]|uniref:bifunctional DedA family/phosphatase PAP2 family protein n=1 Tax=Rhizobium phaseoli TaxID=396 RepID=UPI002552439C|nr:bifunctional DedA family/phosphatase PAP2 family protein [Rhizobium phaseoli]MDK4724970.1 VTT domain-containing protein [Rhizobium phaseoli]